ncbi:MAG TPA: class F sortase [Mycobacteriales bacterium]|nr:class F sortase [Mycobacteriales bacterium]
MPTQDGRVGAAGTTVRPAPVEVELPSIGVRTKVDPVGVDEQGDLQIPEDVADIGWYRFGPRPGDPAGSAVFSGHVDSAEQGQGAFYRLRELDPGDKVVVRTGDGKARTYRVVSREEWPKSEVPLERIFARGGAARITLVTCGGGFREDIRSYQDNIAVTAVPDGTR